MSRTPPSALVVAEPRVPAWLPWVVLVMASGALVAVANSGKPATPAPTEDVVGITYQVEALGGGRRSLQSVMDALRLTPEQQRATRAANPDGGQCSSPSRQFDPGDYVFVVLSPALDGTCDEDGLDPSGEAAL